MQALPEISRTRQANNQAWCHMPATNQVVKWVHVLSVSISNPSGALVRQLVSRDQTKLNHCIGVAWTNPTRVDKCLGG